MKKNYKLKKTISLKQFILEFGETFSEHVKNRLLELEIRCVLTRKEFTYILDIKHVEHTQHDCNSSDSSKTCKKEYVYGQLMVVEGILYFSEQCLEGPTVMKSPIVSTIYNSLSSEDMINDEGIDAKKVDDSNIDYILDNILSVCPDVSQKYTDIVNEMMSHQRN